MRSDPRIRAISRGCVRGAISSGNASALQNCIGATRPGGRIVQVGPELSNNLAQNAMRPVALGRSYEQSGIYQSYSYQHIFAKGLRDRHKVLEAADSKAWA